jgi:hypothetical protein
MGLSTLPIQYRKKDGMSLFSTCTDQLVDFLTGRGEVVPALRLVDVGVSGGLDPVWRRWRNRLEALGIDLLVDEIEHLAGEERNPSIRYVAAQVVAPEGPAKASGAGSNYALHHSQAYFATVAMLHGQGAAGEDSFRRLWRDTIAGRFGTPPSEANYANVAEPMADPFFSYYARRFARQSAPRVAADRTTVDQVVAANEWPTQCDVLKIDTDGCDYDALRGAANLLCNGCLAVEIETQFHGPVSPTANVFCNIDGFLRQLGFTLFKLEPVRYSRSALPRRFLYDIPAQTADGQVVWSDALYLRDLARTAGASRSAEEKDWLRRLALIADVYGLENVASELVLLVPGLFGTVADSDVLDFLARKVHGDGVTYKELTHRFVEDPLGFQKRPSIKQGNAV